MEHRVWAIELTKRVGRRIAELRGKEELTAQQLAERCAELGLPSLSRIVIAKLENGRRESVTAPELLVLAAALDVSPAELIFPFGSSLETSVLPDVQTTVLDAAEWLGGFARLDAARHKVVRASLGRSQETAVQLYASHRMTETSLLSTFDRLQRNIGTSPDVDPASELAAQELAEGSSDEEIHLRAKWLSAQSDREMMRYGEELLQRIRAQMRNRGLPLPVLDERIAQVDSANGNGNGAH